MSRLPAADVAVPVCLSPSHPTREGGTVVWERGRERVTVVEGEGDSFLILYFD